MKPHQLIESQSGQIHLFFGDKGDDSILAMENQFPFVQFRSLNQIHSDILVEAKDDSSHSQKCGQNLIESNDHIDPTADAHWTRKTGLGLIVRTADCIPLLCYQENNPIVLAIHAGWRGVLSQIVPKAIITLERQEGCSIDAWQIYIGPHILQTSFEIEYEIGIKILSTIRAPNKSDFFILNEKGRMQLDLQRIVQHQLFDIGVPESSVYTSKVDTYTNTDYHSYRRDREFSGRQLSFICRAD